MIRRFNKKQTADVYAAEDRAEGYKAHVYHDGRKWVLHSGRPEMTCYADERAALVPGRADGASLDCPY